MEGRVEVDEAARNGIRLDKLRCGDVKICKCRHLANLNEVAESVHIQGTRKAQSSIRG